MPSNIAKDSNIVVDGEEVLVLSHRVNRNRRMPVIVELNDKVAMPSRVDNGTWSVPCEVVGLDSKKAKNIRIRFHAQLAEYSYKYAEIKSVAIKQAFLYMDALLADSDWARGAECQLADQSLRQSQLSHIGRLMAERSASLTVTNQEMNMVWSLGTYEKANTSKHKEVINNAVYLAAAISAKAHIASDGRQRVDVAYEKEGLNYPLLRLDISEPFVVEEIQRKCFVLNKHSLKLSLLRSEPDSVDMPVQMPAQLSCHVVADAGDSPVMLDADQMTVDELRRQLDESLCEFQKRKDSSGMRALHMIRQSSFEAIIEIGEPGCTSAQLSRLVCSSVPLAVICDSPNSLMDLASSPAESTDSGVALSPVVSPTTSMKHSPFYEYSEEARFGLRQRSASESDWSGCSLKGILKKPKSIGGRISRSYSECHSDPSHIRSTLSFEGFLDEDVIQEEDDEDDVIMGLAPRKKRVSFSEKLTSERRFRPNQSIAGQAKKNEKKRLQKKRKEEERDRKDSEGNDSCDSPCKRSARQDSGFVDGDITPPPSPHVESEMEWQKLVRILKTTGI